MEKVISAAIPLAAIFLALLAFSSDMLFWMACTCWALWGTGLGATIIGTAWKGRKTSD